MQPEVMWLREAINRQLERKVMSELIPAPIPAWLAATPEGKEAIRLGQAYLLEKLPPMSASAQLSAMKVDPLAFCLALIYPQGGTRT